MQRSTWFVLAAWALAGMAFADEPKDKSPLPPWQRLLKGDDAKAAADLEKRIDELESTDKYAEAIKLAEELLALRVRVQGADHWQALNRKYALEWLRKVVALPEAGRAEARASAKADEDADAAERRGQFGLALPLRERRLVWCRQVLGEGHRDTAAAYNKLGYNLNTLGRYTDAEPLFQKALAVFRTSLGEGHPDTAAGYNNVAYNLNAQGRYPDAEPLYRKALDICRTAFGDDHPDTVVGYNNVAVNLNAQSRYADAEPLYRKALDIRRKTLGEDHASTATSYGNLAGNLHALGKYADADPLFRKALAIDRKVLGEDHPGTAVSYNNLAFNLNVQSRYADAEALYRKALDIRHKTLGDDHPSTAAGYSNLAGNLNDQGKYADATTLFWKALDIRRKVLGESHPETAVSYNNLALGLNSQGKHADAGRLYQKALDILRNVLGDDHRETATCYSNVAANLSEQRKFVDAEPLYRKALAIHRKVLGENHRETAACYNNAGFNLSAQGRYVDAGPLLGQALNIHRKVLGDDHPNTARYYTTVATNLADQGKYADAEPLFQKALAIDRKSFGDDHPSTVHSINNLAINRHAQGRFADALALLAAASQAYEIVRIGVASGGLDRAAFGALGSPYRGLCASRARLNDATQAWTAAEADLARGLLDESAARRGAAFTAGERAEKGQLITRFTVLQPRVIALVTRAERTAEEDKELAELQADRKRLDEDLGRLAAAVSRREVATLAEVQSALPADAALVLWVDVTDTAGGVQEHWACVVRSSGEPIWEKLPGSGPDRTWTKDDTYLATDFRLALAGNDKTPPASNTVVTVLAKRLFAQRLAPLEKHLRGVRRLEVVPVGEMAGVPVEALTDRFVVSYTPSGTATARRAKRAVPTDVPTLLALGDPVFDRERRAPKPPSALPPGGLLIAQVVPGGAAAKARLQAGDVLLKYAGTALTTVEQLGQLIQANAGKPSVTIAVWREGQERTATKDLPPGKLGVVLAKEPAPEAIASRRKADAMLLALRGGDRAELPGTRVELDRLARLFGPSAERLLDSDASEQRLEDLRAADRLKSYRYIHLATHGEANDAKAFESALILAQDNLPQDPLVNLNRPEGAQFIDGKLTANEVLAGWKLDAELVTLSACESALGRKGGGDGLLGFAQAFLLAGSRSVCLSLWKVDDAATALLMGRFYENLLGKRAGLTKPMPKAEALAEAKAWLRTLSAAEAATQMAGLTGGVARGIGRPALPPLPTLPPVAAADKPYAHPKYWAAFILIGDPE